MGTQLLETFQSWPLWLKLAILLPILFLAGLVSLLGVPVWFLPIPIWFGWRELRRVRDREIPKWVLLSAGCLAFSLLAIAGALPFAIDDVWKLVFLALGLPSFFAYLIDLGMRATRERVESGR